MLLRLEQRNQGIATGRLPSNDRHDKQLGSTGDYVA